jgi:threonine dehydrogenase-like Zn-dependent dehydrogenase
MKALAVFPHTPHSMHLEDVPKPSLDDIAGGRGVLVQVLRVGVDGTDREINEGKYGEAPPDSNFLITGHENFGRVVAVGPNVPGTITPGMYVVATVRRPGHSIYDQIGLQDMTTDDVYYERGINLLHGYLTEYYVDNADFIVPLPANLREVGVLMEPMSVSQKGINQAFETQRRLKVWRPQRAAVIGAGTVSLLAALMLRLRGLEVMAYSRRPTPYYNSDLIAEIGGHYVSSYDTSLAEASAQYGPFDIIFEATGYSPLAFAAAEVLGKNGVLILASITGSDTKVEVNTDRINQGFVLGNKVMVGTVNASRADFESGVTDFVRAEAFYPGWLNKLLTTKVNGLENYEEMLQHLESKDAIKVFIQVAPDEASAAAGS